MKEDDLNVSLLPKKINALRKLGVPYEQGYENQALADLEKQAEKIAKSVVTDIYNKLPKEAQKSYDKQAEIAKMKKKEIVAIIAYLQRLGTDIKAEPTETK
jgi:cytochrome c oxidase cbb3-type subunit I/II